MTALTLAPGHFDGDGCTFPTAGHLVTPTQALMHEYLTARGLDLAFDEPANAEFVVEEADELEQALHARNQRWTDETNTHAQHELADVVLAAAVLAEANGWSLEECIRAKTLHDRNRGRGRR